MQKDTNYTFDSVRVVMVNTTEPGNIGAAARAMKNMNLSKLYLVNPKGYPSAVATARASGADDLLANAVVCETLEEALQGSHLVIGASARQRNIKWKQWMSLVHVVRSNRPLPLKAKKCQWCLVQKNTALPTRS